MKSSQMFTAAILTLMLAGSTMAHADNSKCKTRSTFAQQHPRRAQVLNRDARLNSKINQDYGHLGGHYWQLEKQDNAIRNQEQRDARMNGGHITAGEQRQLNHEENHLNQEVRHDYAEGRPNGDFREDHPRRAEVLGRDAHMGQEISNDRGHLGGNYGQLQQEQNNIYHQEQQDAHQNGGWITKQQQQQLNGEENQLQQQINQDFNK